VKIHQELDCLSAAAPARRCFGLPGAPVALTALGLLLSLVGCNSGSSSVGGGAQTSPTSDPAMKRQLFDTAIDNLNHLEQFQAQDMLGRIVEHLNEAVDWSRPVDWSVDPLVASLPEVDRDLQPMRDLVTDKFLGFDSFYLQEAVTLRNISRDARGEQADDLARATKLFDWVVRNVSLMEPGELGVDSAGQPLEPNHLPYQTVFLGRGDVIDRAWVFVLLCRQQGIDAAVLALPGDTADAPLRTWAVGVLIDGELRVFDPKLGLPILGTDGTGVAKLSELAANDALLRRLDLDAEHAYPVTAAQLAGTIALVEGSPGYLSRRMKRVESRLTGDRRIVLTTEPSQVADRLRKCPGVRDALLWRLPYERLRFQSSPDATEPAKREMRAFQSSSVPKKFQGSVQALARGRTLQLAGRYTGEAGDESANRSYQMSRVADADMAAAKLTPEESAVLRAAKLDASYWLALVAFERGKFDAAIEHLTKRVLGQSDLPGGGVAPAGDAPAAAADVAAAPDQAPNVAAGAAPAGKNPWRDGALYLLARTHEALGHTDQAVAAFEATTGPQRHGNLLRARWLKEPPKAIAPATDATNEADK
jgi:hypothetical protein